MVHRRNKSLLALVAVIIMTASAATNASCVVVHGRRHGRHRRRIRGRHRRHHGKRKGHHKRRHHSSTRTSRRTRSWAKTTFGRSGRFVEYGKATWYGGRFHGRKTASGERFDQNALTAAHKTLPFDTWVQVTRLDNGRSVTVRINDRGPYGKGRIVDLSKAAAAKIGSLKRGVVRVKLTVVRWGKGRYRRTGKKTAGQDKKTALGVRSSSAAGLSSTFVSGRARRRSALVQGGFGKTTVAP